MEPVFAYNSMGLYSELKHMQNFSRMYTYLVSMECINIKIFTEIDQLITIPTLLNWYVPIYSDMAYAFRVNALHLSSAANNLQTNSGVGPFVCIYLFFVRKFTNFIVSF